MKITKRICCGALVLLLALGMTACAPQGEGGPTPTPQGTGEVTPTPGTSATPEPTAQPTGEETDPSALVETEDVVQKLMNFPRDTVLLTVNGTPVTAESYLYCLAYATESVCSTLYESMDQVDWEGGMVGEAPLQTYITDSAVETAAFYTLIRDRAAENGVGISAADQAELDMYIASVIASLGGKEEYALRLQMLGVSDRAFRALNEVNILYDGLEQKLFGSQNPSDEELIRFAEETADAMMAKHILIKTVDDSNQPLSDEEIAAAKAKAEDLLAQLRASDDPLTLFDKLMNEHSQDGRYEDGTLASADGYLFGPGYMVPEFENGTRALKYNEISDLVKSDFGYHIILRLPPVNDEVRAAWVSAGMNGQVTEWVDTAEVETTETFSQVSPKDYFERMNAYRTALMAPEEGAG